MDRQTNMRTGGPWRRAAACALLLAAGAGGAVAQQLLPTRVDVAPLPAEERASIGAVVFADAPVLAQRELLKQLTVTRKQANPPPRSSDRAVPEARPDSQGGGRQRGGEDPTPTQK